jgi:hypothetical protein
MSETSNIRAADLLRQPKSLKSISGGLSIGQFVSPSEDKSSKVLTQPFSIPRQGEQALRIWLREYSLLTETRTKKSPGLSKKRRGGQVEDSSSAT